MGEQADYVIDSILCGETDYDDYEFLMRMKASGIGPCPICGANTVLRDGKYGKFYGCENFPKCNGSRRF